MSILTNAIRIELPLAELSDRRDCRVKSCYLELYPQYVSYKVIADYEELYKDTGIWDATKSNYRWAKRRSDLAAVEMWRIKKEEGKYCVSLEFSGVGNVDGWYWEDPNEALRVYEQLRNYMLQLE